MIRCIGIFIAILAVLVCAADASARITLTLDPSVPATADNLAALERDQIRIDGSLMPWPDATVSVIYVTPACNGSAEACSGMENISVDPNANETTITHEITHATVDYYLTDFERTTFMALAANAGMIEQGATKWWDWRPGVAMAGEAFAIAWTKCSMYRGQVTELCAWLYNVGASKGWQGGESVETRTQILEAAAIARRKAATRNRICYWTTVKIRTHRRLKHRRVVQRLKAKHTKLCTRKA